VSIEDLESPSAICEMCEETEIRYVHRMHHPDYAAELDVGCICAGHMEGDVAGARAREAAAKGRAARRKRWLTRRWRTSAKGNPTIKSDGYRTTVYPRGKGWAATIASVDDPGDVHHSRRNYPTADQAKLAAFDEISRRKAL
jgi:hypothetical protein